MVGSFALICVVLVVAMCVLNEGVGGVPCDIKPSCVNFRFCVVLSYVM